MKADTNAATLARARVLDYRRQPQAKRAQAVEKARQSLCPAWQVKG